VPAVNGVKYVMRAAQRHRVKRVVITSSIASVYRLPEDRRPDVFTEEHWSDLEYSSGSAYIKSKTIAEKYAWDFQKAMDSIGQYCPEIATICPSVVLGEAITAGATTSTAIITGLLNGKTTKIPNIDFVFCDIKDVTSAHLRAMERANAANKRFIVSIYDSEPYMNLVTYLKEANFNINAIAVSDCMMRFKAMFDSSLKDTCLKLGQSYKISNQQARDILGIKFERTVKDLAIQTANDLIKNGTVSSQ
jgi:dihydroflavonol-4-reductase